jgi:transcriptional regulator with XRE-family HTH domain
MVRRSENATPNITLSNLRESRGESQKDVAEAINQLAGRSGKKVAVTANQISRWERGVAQPIPLYRRLLAEHFGRTVADLGLVHPRSERTAMPVTAVLDHVAAPPRHITEEVTASQNQWRTTRRLLNSRRVPLSRAVANLYPTRLAETGLLVHPNWLPPQPVRIDDIQIRRVDSPEPAIAGTDGSTAGVRPLAEPGRRFHRYSQAIRAIEHPRLFENRLSWRLAGCDWVDGRGSMQFGEMSYFDLVDLGEVAAHEAADRLIDPTGQVGPHSWRGLHVRRAIGDPFDTSRRMIGAAVDTLTIRRDRDGASFVLHQRDSGNVAVAGGMLHVMPCGIFQPSSVHPKSLLADFSLWRNIQREYSEEFLGNPEHDGSGSAVDYRRPPFDAMQRAADEGALSVYCLGVGLDALTLVGEILTVAVFDADVYDTLFADMVDVNEEGTVVKTGSVRPTSAIPFTEHMVAELIGGGRLAPAAAGCLRLAWQHRRMLLDR